MNKTILVLLTIFLFIFSAPVMATKTDQCLPVTDSFKKQVKNQVGHKWGSISGSIVRIVHYSKKTICYKPGIAIYRIKVYWEIPQMKSVRIIPMIIVVRYNTQKKQIVYLGNERNAYKKYPNLEDKIWATNYFSP
ncbi:hypothetical protein HOD96_01050 [Candidatus Falkowbacteria bacterium]|jgi:hypothetical protein|nr:hypothetical protein [Candidatus Falkowbacteria bacterium]MBT4433379.1 hypothetical protein [Candidatus Falkowbacteria bacterium]